MTGLLVQQLDKLHMTKFPSCISEESTPLSQLAYHLLSLSSAPSIKLHILRSIIQGYQNVHNVHKAAMRRKNKEFPQTYFAYIGTVIRLNIFITKFFMDYFLFMVANLQRDRLFSVAKY